MGSPFPGMDPYLEGDLWQEFHETLASEIRAQALGKLPQQYVALLAKRYVLDRPALGILDLPNTRVFYPDVHIAERAGAPATAVARDTATLTPPSVEVPDLAPVPQLSVEIRDVAQRRLVTVVEILSPANKHGSGLSEYLERRRDLLHTETHVLELDLLRGGERIPLGEVVPEAAYYAYLNRTQRRAYTQVWAVAINQRLPVLPVPLLPPDADVTLDLQAAVDSCFALVGYERLLDYTAPLPPPALPPAAVTWIEQRVRQAGIL